MNKDRIINLHKMGLSITQIVKATGLGWQEVHDTIIEYWKEGYYGAESSLPKWKPYEGR